MKKVVFFVTSLNSGGIENYLLRFLNFFEGQIEPIVICKGNVFGELEEEYQKIAHIQLIKMDVGYFNLNSYYKLYSFFKRSKVNSVCDFTGNFAGLILLSANFAGIDNRISFYRGSTNRFKESKARLVFNLFMLQLVKKNATKILSNSKAALDYFYSDRNNKEERFKVIYNGIDSIKYTSNLSRSKKEIFGIPSDGFVIGHTGRYNSAKNHDTIIKVAEKICKKYSNVYFILCGKDTDVFLSERISNNFVLKDKMRLLGYRNDVQDILAVFDLYFFPSITEGQPNSLIEAMISGLPIIASNIGPIIETTPATLHNELLTPLDVDGFCTRIEEYYLSRQKREENNFSSWAKKQFAPEVLFNQFYKEL
jgi:glycosyltransferase involved in cell wall biosynthesis